MQAACASLGPDSRLEIRAEQSRETGSHGLRETDAVRDKVVKLKELP